MMPTVLLQAAEVDLALVPEADPAIATVVVTGFSLVFAILILLYVILLVEGKIFQAIDKRKQQKQVQNAVQPSPAAQPAPPMVQPGIPPEVVAAIAAAVAAESDGRYTLRAVSTRQKGRGRWGLAGVIQTTEPF